MQEGPTMRPGPANAVWLALEVLELEMGLPKAFAKLPFNPGLRVIGVRYSTLTVDSLTVKLRQEIVKFLN